ncbi:hypothetical protein ACS0TY_002097 [Phlomoides rotata]
MTPIRAYMESGVEPKDRVQARQLWSQCGRYTIQNDILYKWGINISLLKCLTEKEGTKVLIEIHIGIYGNHTSGNVLADQMIRVWYYWTSLR